MDCGGYAARLERDLSISEVKPANREGGIKMKKMDLPGGSLSGRLAGSYRDTSLHFWAANLRIAF